MLHKISPPSPLLSTDGPRANNNPDKSKANSSQGHDQLPELHKQTSTSKQGSDLNLLLKKQTQALVNYINVEKMPGPFKDIALKNLQTINNQIEEQQKNGSKVFPEENLELHTQAMACFLKITQGNYPQEVQAIAKQNIEMLTPDS